MIGLIGEWIKKIAIVILLASFVDLILPSSEFRKYVKMVFGVMILLVIMEPIGTILLCKSPNFEDYLKQYQFKIETQSKKKEQKQYEITQQQMIIDTYKQRLQSQIQAIIERCEDVKINEMEVVVDEQMGEDTFGTILGISMEVEKNSQNKAAAVLMQPIQKIRIGAKTDHQEKIENKETNRLKKNIKKSLVDFYNLSESNIHITVEEIP